MYFKELQEHKDIMNEEWTPNVTEYLNSSKYSHIQSISNPIHPLSSQNTLSQQFQFQAQAFPSCQNMLKLNKILHFTYTQKISIL